MISPVELKTEIWNYLQERYEKTKWPNFYLVTIQNKFGPNAKAALNLLREDGLVKKGHGINGVLIIIVENE